MDIRFLLILAVVAAIMEILGRLARKGAGTGAPRVPGPDGADPLMQQLEELQWVPGAHDDEDDTPAPRRERAALERPAAATAAATATAPERVREPEPLPTELPPAPVPRQPRPAPVPRQPRPAPVPRQPPPAQERVLVLRDRAPRPVPVRSSEPRRVEVRPVEPHPVAPPLVKPRPAEREAPASAGGWLGLGKVDGLRRLVVAREVLGPPIALRDEERVT